MAHSRIFQLTDEYLFKGGNADDIINETDFYEIGSFLGPVADSVSDECDRKEDFDDLVEFLAKAVGHDPKNNDLLAWHFSSEDSETAEAYITFKPGYRKEYFNKRYELFQAFVAQTTPDVFMGDDNNFSLWLLKQAFGDMFGFYVWLGEGYVVMLDDFLRRLPNDQEATYWLGGTVNYRY